MKTYKNLYPQIHSFENLYLAYKAAARGKRGRPDVATFEMNLEDNLFQLQAELESQTYMPGPYRHFTIYEPKRRRISAAPFCDRVIHHALVRVIEPIFERRFIHDSYACRKGKGTHRALDRCTQFAQQHRYVLKCDIVKFFPSIEGRAGGAGGCCAAARGSTIITTPAAPIATTTIPTTSTITSGFG